MPPFVEEVRPARGGLDRPEGAALGQQREGGHRALADRVEIGDLGRIGARVGVVDDHDLVALEHRPGRRIVLERVGLVDRAAAIRRVVAVGQDLVRGFVPIADPAFVGARRHDDVASGQVADLARVERLGKLGRQLDDVRQLARRRAEPARELPDEQGDQAERRGDRDDVEGGHDPPRDRVAGRQHAVGATDEDRDTERDEAELGQRAAPDVGQCDGDREQGQDCDRIAQDESAEDDRQVQRERQLEHEPLDRDAADAWQAPADGPDPEGREPDRADEPGDVSEGEPEERQADAEGEGDRDEQPEERAQLGRAVVQPDRADLLARDRRCDGRRGGHRVPACVMGR